MRKYLWYVHNAIKLVAYTTYFFPPIVNTKATLFLLVAAYEFLSDPFVLRACGRDRMVADTAVHHTFVLAWSVAIRAYDGIGTAGASAVSLARVLTYGGVFSRRIRPAASLAVGLQFAFLVVDAARSFCSTPVFAGCQMSFVIVFVAYQALKKSNVGILLVYPPPSQQDMSKNPIITPLWTPDWAKLEGQDDST